MPGCRLPIRPVEVLLEDRARRPAAAGVELRRRDRRPAAGVSPPGRDVLRARADAARRRPRQGWCAPGGFVAFPLTLAALTDPPLSAFFATALKSAGGPRASARSLTPCSMSCDIKKSAGTIASHPNKVIHHGEVTHRDRKWNRVRWPPSIGRSTKAHDQSSDALSLQLSG